MHISVSQSLGSSYFSYPQAGGQIAYIVHIRVIDRSSFTTATLSYGHHIRWGTWYLPNGLCNIILRGTGGRSSDLEVVRSRTRR